MCKKTILLTLVLVLGLVSFAWATDSVWDAGGATNNWLDRFNWLGDQLPENVGVDTRIMTGGMAIPPNQIEVNGVVEIGMAGQSTRLQLVSAAGATDAANRDTIIFNGEFRDPGSSWLGINTFSPGFGHIIVNEGAYAGTFDFVGTQGGDIIIDMNGGYLEDSWQISVSGGANASFVLNLMGGTFRCEPINVNPDGAVLLIDITGGTLDTSAGAARLQELIDYGQLVADGGTNPRAYIAIAGRIVTAVIPDPGQAYAPTPFPPLTSTVVNIDQVLGWSAGDGAESHKVYLGADEPNNMVLVQESGDLTYTQPGLYELNTTYYWKVDEVQAAGPDIEGTVWAFTTLAYIAVEDFEAYSDGGVAITDFWPSEIDSWDSGSTVSLSVDPVAGGEKAMQLDYDNLTPAYGNFSETTRSLVADFTPKDVVALFVSVMGDPCNAAERIYMRISDSSTSATEYLQVRDIADPNHTATADVNLLDDSWQTAMIDLSTLGLVLTDIQSITLGVGDKDHPVATGMGTIYVDDIQLRTSTCVYAAPGADLSGDCKVDFADFGIFPDDWLNSGLWP